MSDLQTQLDRLTADFVSSVLAAFGSATLSDLAPDGAGGRGPALRMAGRRETRSDRADRGGRRRRSTPDEVQRQKDLALSTARTLKPGFSKGEVMKKTGSQVDLGRALTLLVKDGKLTKKGDRRFTRYWVK